MKDKITKGGDMSEAFEIFYDGDCPVCAAFIRMARLREAVGRVDLIDARSDHPRLGAIRAAGYDLDAGMVVRHGDLILHGAAAMRMVTLLSERRGLLRALLRSPRRAALLYPVLAAGRRVLLRMLRRRPIGS